MLRKLRIKFIAVCMALITLTMAVVVGAVLFSAGENLERISREVLHRAMAEKPGHAPPDMGEGAVVLPYFSIDIWGDTLYVTGGTYDHLEDTETLNAVVSAALAEEKPEGLLPRYGLRYLRRDDGWHTRLAFVDFSVEAAAMRRMLFSCILIALLSLIPLFGVSLLLSRWAVGPVERAWRQQRQFLSDASHELKTPLTVILSNAELLEHAQMDERARRWTDNIRSESRRMKTLVEEMLSLARTETGERSPVLGEVSLSDIAADCALSFEPVAFESGKPLRYEIAPGVLVSGDGEKLRRLISVLLDNAIKYGAAGGTVSLTLETAGRQARLITENPGERIAPEVLSHLFERFYRGDASRGEQSGFGLGLSIATAIASEHGGTLKAESDETSTRFLFTVPLRRPARPDRQRLAGKTEPVRRDGGPVGGEPEDRKELADPKMLTPTEEQTDPQELPDAEELTDPEEPTDGGEEKT